MHNSVYQKMGLDLLYVPLELEIGQLETVVRTMEHFNYAGSGVTMPFKTLVHKYLDGLADSAVFTEVVNTIVIEKDGRKIGHNTDGTGFVRSLEDRAGLKIPDHRYLILGSGGAATAIACALAAKGAARMRSLCILQDFSCAEALYSRVNTHFPGICEIGEMNEETIRRGLHEFDVIIHATKVGLYPKVDEVLFDTTLLDESHLVCDVVYVPMETRLLKESGKRGCRTLSGIWMNVYQAAEQMRLWAGIDPPVDFMYQCGIEYLAREGKLSA